MHKQQISYDTMHSWCMHITREITKSNWKPHVVVGITRGGVMPAVVISHELDVPLICWHVSLRDSVINPEPAHWFAPLVLQNKQVLIVDDINDSGATLDWIRSHLTERLTWISKPHSQFHDFVRTAVLLTKPMSSCAVDYHGVVIESEHSHVWWEFPWEKVVDI
jgi:uncharacterized protein